MSDDELKEDLVDYFKKVKNTKFIPFFDYVSFSLDKKVLTITCPSFIESKIKKNYQTNIESYLKMNFNDEISLKYVISEEPVVIPTKPTKKESSSETPKIQSKENKFCKLNPLFTFETFIEGQNNKHAKKIALLAASHIGSEACNPLLILGQVGMGKTHLMQAIAHRILEENPEMNVICISSQDLIDTLYDNVKSKMDKKNNTSFSLFENADAFLIDDIHLFKGKDGLQHELFILFNKLKDNGKQICFTCDRPISELPNFTDRLASRIKSGITVDISEPTADVKFKILKQKTEQLKKENIFNHKNLKLEESVYFYLSENIFGNVRDLEGILKSFLFFIDFNSDTGTLEDAKEYIKENKNMSKVQNDTKISMDLIVKKVSDFYNVSTADIKSKSRKKNIVILRQTAVYIATQMTELTTTEIGDYFGQDHSTVINSKNKISNYIKFKNDLKSDINEIQNSLKNC